MKSLIYNIKSILSFNGKVKGNPYRIISIESDTSLYDLAAVITDSFNFDMDHCFGFYDNLRNPYKSIEGYEYFTDLGSESKFPGVENTRLYEAFDEVKKKFLFLFDYGDDWRFIIQLLSIEEKVSEITYPKIVKIEGESPEQYPSYEDEYNDEEE